MPQKQTLEKTDFGVVSPSRVHYRRTVAQTMTTAEQTDCGHTLPRNGVSNQSRH